MFCLTAFAFFVNARVETDSPIQRYEGLKQIIRWVKLLDPRQSFRMWVNLESLYGMC